MPMTLDEFIVSETCRLLQFGKCWREAHDKKPEVYPEEFKHEIHWVRKYSGYVIDQAEKQFATENEEEAVANENTESNEAA